VAPSPPQPAQAPVNEVKLAPPAQVDPISDASKILSHRRVHFDFDKSVIHDPDLPQIQAPGSDLVDRLSGNIRIERNWDERGGREYNLALGPRRADAVLERPKVVGVMATRDGQLREAKAPESGAR
jgi:peptidoglycan-associated lipoprotein